jgi:hypothetical protein
MATNPISLVSRKDQLHLQCDTVPPGTLLSKAAVSVVGDGGISQVLFGNGN